MITPSNHLLTTTTPSPVSPPHNTHLQNLNLPHHHPKRRHLIHSLRRERLPSVNAPRKPVFSRPQLNSRIYKPILLNQRLIPPQHRVKIPGHNSPSRTAQQLSSDRDLLGAEGRLDWEGVEVDVYKAEAGAEFVRSF